MKKIILALLVITIFACKNEKNTKDSLENEVKTEEKKEVFTKVKFPAYPGWGKVGVEITETTEVFLGEKVHKLARSAKATKSSLAHTQKIAVNYAENYKASIIVKKGENSNLFGLRISGAYPDRVDAVFDLEKGEVKGVKKSRDFENESADIQALGDNWYKCSVRAEVAADQINIIFGPTTEDMSVYGWEAKSNVESSSLILPSSLTLENVSFE